MSRAIHLLRLDSPLGTLELQGDGRAVTAITTAASAEPLPPAPYLEQAARELEEYFAGRRECFTFPIAPEGTPFQKAVWEGLRQIPYGHTETYGALAARIGHPGAARAVGTAAGKNPILLAIPCHRLVAAGGLGGFSCGLERKRILLELEKQ